MKLNNFNQKLHYILLTRPGCGLGNLDWKNVKKILLQYFESNKFKIVDLNYGESF